MTMKVLIVEDEAVAAENLTYVLRRMDSSVEIVAYAESVGQTVAILSERPDIDLIFMDVHLSDGSAFCIFDKVKVTAPIVFTTAYDQYALEAFRVNSIDYLLKPIKPEELRRAIDKYRQRTPKELLAYIASMQALEDGHHYPSRIIVPRKDRFIPVQVSDIAYVYSTNRRTELALADGTRIAVGKTLEQLQAVLNPKDFMRVNKQFVISKGSVKELVAWFDSRLIVRMAVDTPEEIFISKNRVAEFKKWLTD